MSKSISEKIRAWEEKGRIRKIIKVLNRAESGSNVQYALWALKRMGSDKAADAVVAFLDDKENEKLEKRFSYQRSDALEALGGMKSQKAVERLLFELENGFSHLRESVIQALGSIGSDQAVPSLLALFDDQIVDKLTEKQEDAVITALGQIRSEKAVDRLLEILASGRPRRRIVFQERILLALGQIGSKKAVDPLIEFLKSPESDLRQEAAQALGNIGSDRAVGPLLEALKDEELIVRICSAEALGKIGAEAAVLPLISFLGNTEYNLRERAARALKKIDTPTARDAYREYRISRPASKEKEKLPGLCFVFINGDARADDQLLVRAIIKSLSLNVHPRKCWVYPSRPLPDVQAMTARILAQAAQDGIEVDLDRVEVCDFNIRAYGVTGKMAVAYL